jgi:DcuC family C4-dicarboxylate transporter
MILGSLIALGFIIVLGYLLLKNFNPHASLLVGGLLMLAIAMLLGLETPLLNSASGLKGFDLFVFISESFAKTNAKVGLMIMAIGGFVAYIDKIEASKALVKLALKPLSLLKKKPGLAAIMVLPIGQMLFVCIPSAAGLGLLLMASVFPILVGLGVSRLSAVSVITACTAFGMGPASAMTAAATDLAGLEVVSYFIKHQLPLMLPLSLIMMVSYFFVNRYFDRKEAVIKDKTESTDENEIKLNVPMIYAIIPVLPLFLLVFFSEIFNFLPIKVKLDTTTAMFISLFVGIIFELIRTRNVKATLNGLNVFWNGMGNIFKTVVTLIIAADIFAKGLIALGFIDGLVELSQSIGLEALGIAVVMTIIIFLASMLMGSGNASFFAFGPLVPKIASMFGVSNVSFILPMNMAASMGRTASPVAGVIIATAEIAGVSALQIVKRNIIPLVIALVSMLTIHFVL